MSASTKQINFLSSLLAETEAGLAAAAEKGATDVLAAVTEALTPEIAAAMKAVREGSALIESRDASKAIDTLLKTINPLLKPFTAVALPVGLVSFNALKVIVNKLAKACHVCGNRVDIGAGHALLIGPKNWLTVCKACGEVDPAEREAALAAKRAEAQAKADAEQAAREKAAAEERSRRAYIEAFAIDLFDRAAVSDHVQPNLHLAITSATGNNDLDFWRVTRKDNVTTVYRVLGGHADIKVTLAQAEAALIALALTEDIPNALATYGREFERCGMCHKSLTNKSSRDAGLGPDCASKIGAMVF